MTLLLELLFFVLACVVLVKSAGIIVNHLTRISSFLGLNEFAIGFIIMAISTTLPELFIGITSGLRKDTAIALGTVIGSNIADLTIIIGVVVLVTKSIRIRSHIIRRDLVYMLFILVLPILLMLWPPTWLNGAPTEATLSRAEGLLLILVFVFYLYMTIRQEHSFHKEIHRASRHEAMSSFLVTALMAGALFGSSHFVVKHGLVISAALNVPPILVGIFLIALGTSLPELSFQLKAVKGKHEEMALGDLIGAVIVNSTLVLGITALISPIHANFFIFFTSAMFMVVIAFIFLTFAESDGGLNWKEGISLVMLYVFFVIVESYIKTLQ
ncbi:sodium:calcium antiporter [Candidatus Woesearchaeota archaeon]|nr:sodium:calcium antiporter [Candidatus Woesearchaeota archaeon]